MGYSIVTVNTLVPGDNIIVTTADMTPVPKTVETVSSVGGIFQVAFTDLTSVQYSAGDFIVWKSS